jgi:hypothetical protein
MNAPHRHSGLLVTEIELLRWLGQAKRGEQLTYHHGFLAVDRIPILGRLSESGARELSRVASLAWRSQQTGIAHLLQRRLGPNNFSYVIVAGQQMPGAMPASLERNPVPSANQGTLAHAA